jgi:hypothetical protein
MLLTHRRILAHSLAVAALLVANSAAAQKQAEPTYPPQLPGGKPIVTDRSDQFLDPPETLKKDVAIAKTPPTVEFIYYPGQDYPGKPWSNWGDSLVANGKYYSAIGDHLAISGKGDRTHGTGTAFVFEFDPKTKALRRLSDLAKDLRMPAGHYTPGKIHTRIDMGSDGWLYYATRRVRRLPSFTIKVIGSSARIRPRERRRSSFTDPCRSIRSRRAFSIPIA